MNNLLLIVIIFLIAAVNTLIIVSVVNFVFKLRVRKESETIIEKKEYEILKPEQQDEITIPVSLPELKTDMTENEKSGKEKEIERQPRFLKYTSKGYINPGNDIKKTKHNWR